MGRIFDGFIGIILGIVLFGSMLAGIPELIMIVVAFFIGVFFLKGISDIFRK